MTMSRPRVSVLLPTYNYARYLPAAIESILAQRDVDFELLISDDASTDESSTVIRHYSALDPRIRVLINERNIGMVPNWNQCLSLARGEYVKFLFGDDCLARDDSLLRLATLLDRHPEAVLATSARLVINDEGSVLEVWDELGEPGEYSGAGVTTRCLARDQNLIGEPSAVMFRRAAASRGFEPALRQVVDLEMWFYLLMSGTLVYEKTPLCAFRRHERQQTEVNRTQNLGILETLRLTARYLPELCRRGGVSRRERARIAYRSRYYSQKRNPRTGEILAAEAALADLVSPAQRFGFWLAHRLSRPWQNAVRSYRKRWRPEEFLRANALPTRRAARVDWTPLTWRRPDPQGSALTPAP